MLHLLLRLNKFHRHLLLQTPYHQVRHHPHHLVLGHLPQEDKLRLRRHQQTTDILLVLDLMHQLQ